MSDERMDRAATPADPEATSGFGAADHAAGLGTFPAAAVVAREPGFFSGIAVIIAGALISAFAADAGSADGGHPGIAAFFGTVGSALAVIGAILVAANILRLWERLGRRSRESATPIPRREEADDRWTR